MECQRGENTNKHSIVEYLLESWPDPTFNSNIIMGAIYKSGCLKNSTNLKETDLNGLSIFLGQTVLALAGGRVGVANLRIACFCDVGESVWFDQGPLDTLSCSLDTTLTHYYMQIQPWHIIKMRGIIFQYC